MSNSLLALKDFVTYSNTKGFFDDVALPDNEIGELFAQIQNTYLTLEKSDRKVSKEREKLVAHISLSREGVAFFAKDDQ